MTKSFGLLTLQQAKVWWVRLESFKNTGMVPKAYSVISDFDFCSLTHPLSPSFHPLVNSRPVYSYVTGLNEESAPTKDDNLALIYSGSRYFIMNLAQAKNNATSTYWQWQFKNYHGFWSGAYHPSISFLISEPTESDTPVGVDFL